MQLVLIAQKGNILIKYLLRWKGMIFQLSASLFSIHFLKASLLKSCWSHKVIQLRTRNCIEYKNIETVVSMYICKTQCWFAISCTGWSILFIKFIFTNWKLTTKQAVIVSNWKPFQIFMLRLALVSTAWSKLIRNHLFLHFSCVLI